MALVSIQQSDPGAGYQAHRREIENAIQEVLESGWYIKGQKLAAFERDFAACSS